MHDFIAEGIALLNASGNARDERRKRRDEDRVFQFLDAVYRANDEDTAFGGIEAQRALFMYVQSARYCRRQRADKLRFIRQAVILNGRCNTRAKLLEACKALRREERHRRYFEIIKRNLAAFDASLSRTKMEALS